MVLVLKVSVSIFTFVKIEEETAQRNNVQSFEMPASEMIIIIQGRCAVGCVSVNYHIGTLISF